MYDSPITLGRSDDSKIKLKFNQLSRKQCRIDYINTNWILSDGDGTKRSTNGIWIKVEEPFEIKEKTLFKAGQIIFVSKFKPKN